MRNAGSIGRVIGLGHDLPRAGDPGADGVTWLEASSCGRLRMGRHSPLRLSR
jgi:hypothetical protein